VSLQNTIPYPLSLIPYPLSLIPYPLSLIPYPLSLIPYPLSLIPYPLSLIPEVFDKKMQTVIALTVFATSLVVNLGFTTTRDQLS
jgi:hypothetical protein